MDLRADPEEGAGQAAAGDWSIPEEGWLKDGS